MNHFVRAALVFFAIPLGLVAVLLVADWVCGVLPPRKTQWYDPWIGGACVIAMLAAVAWSITE